MPACPSAPWAPIRLGPWCVWPCSSSLPSSWPPTPAVVSGSGQNTCGATQHEILNPLRNCATTLQRPEAWNWWKSWRHHDTTMMYAYMSHTVCVWDCICMGCWIDPRQLQWVVDKVWLALFVIDHRQAVALSNLLHLVYAGRIFIFLNLTTNFYYMYST